MPSVRFAGHREGLRQDVVEGLLEALVLALAAVLGQLATAFQIGMVELVLGWLVGRGRLERVGAELVERGADLLVGEGLVFGFEGVRLVDERLQSSDLAVVRVDESGKESHGR
jgi:hypothetical protein